MSVDSGAFHTETLRKTSLRRTLGRAPAGLYHWTIVGAAFGRARGAKRRWVVLAVYQQTFAGTGRADVDAPLATFELVWLASRSKAGLFACSTG